MKLLLLFCLAWSLAGQTTLKYWAGEHEKAVLADYAMSHWAAGSAGQLKVVKVATAAEAELRFRWVNPQRKGLYGQSIARMEQGRLVHELVINPDTAKPGADPLLAEAILFLTCVHESGHALGLIHTRDFADIMYSFEFGGDFDEYFGRYRRRLLKREDMARVSPLAEGDRRQLKNLLADPPQK
jgi:predicted Zn-dependent protease